MSLTVADLEPLDVSGVSKGHGSRGADTHLSQVRDRVERGLLIRDSTESVSTLLIVHKTWYSRVHVVLRTIPVWLFISESERRRSTSHHARRSTLIPSKISWVLFSTAVEKQWFGLAHLGRVQRVHRGRLSKWVRIRRRKI